MRRVGLGFLYCGQWPDAKSPHRHRDVPTLPTACRDSESELGKEKWARAGGQGQVTLLVTAVARGA